MFNTSNKLKNPESRIKTALVGATSVYLGSLAFVGVNQHETAAPKHHEIVVSSLPNTVSQQSLIGSELPPKGLLRVTDPVAPVPVRLPPHVASRSRREVMPKVHATPAVEQHSGAHNFLAPTAVQLHVLRDCESGSNYQYNDGQFYGAYNDDLTTWHGMGYSGRPDQASPAVQDAANTELIEARGFQPFPGCSRKHPDELTATPA
jgi:hypothetical protein